MLPRLLAVSTRPSSDAVTSCALGGLLGFFGFEEVAGLCEVEGVSVHDEFVVAGVVGDFEYAFYLVAALAKSCDEKIDIYHAGKCTGSFLGWVMKRDA